MNSYLRSTIHTALLASALGSGVAAAAEPQQTTFIEEIEVIVVTGSYIEGAAEDAALPIDVLRAEDLAKQGSPTMVDLIRSIPSVQGTVGESNQFTAPNTSGTASINLRGLGAARTLILMNGRRLAPSPSQIIGYDANLLPTAAMSRIEVLKDGAAATYGSDAVAGVVNFITRRGLEGMTLEGNYNYIDGSDGDYGANLAWGTKGDGWDVLVAGGYRRRSELSTTDRDFAVQSITDNPNGGYSGFANPGTFLVGANRFVDPGCEPLGNVITTNAMTGAQTCNFQFSQFDNLVEDEDHYNVYAEFNMLFGETTELHVEAMYAAHDVPHENSSPSYAPTQGATLVGNNPTGPNFIIPRSNPGLTPEFIAQLPAAVQAALASPTSSVIASGLLWRPYGVGGNPLTGEGKEDERFFDGYRIAASLKGEVSAVNWDVGVTYMENNREIVTPDIITTRLALALRGLGGPNCVAANNTPGQNGCLWLNPFSTGVQRNLITGALSPNFVSMPNVNTVELADWLFEDNGSKDKTSTFVVDAVLNGQLPFGLSGGDIGWAAGAQYREETLEREPIGFSDITQFPCVDSVNGNIITGNQSCNVPTGVFSFLGPLGPLDLTRDVKAVFGELNVPILESLSAQVAVRHETYGEPVGSTTNPKLSLRWQALDWLALRGSVGTTFRGPLQTQLDPGAATTLTFTPAANGYKIYDVVGDPNLKPEEALTLNVGFIVKAGGFSGTLDYWSYDFEDALETESGPEMVARFFGTNPNAPLATLNQNCDNPALADLQARFTFNGTCSLANLLRVRTETVNGPDQRLSGLDLGLQYAFESVLGGNLLVGADATYTLEYERDASFIGTVQIQAAGDFAGTRGASGVAGGSLPEIRGSAYVDYSTNWLASQGIRLTARYVDGVTDVRSGLASTTTRGVEVGSFLTYDLVYRLSLPQETTLTASVINLTDRDPPFARLDLGYDTFLANPYGRYFKMLLNKKF